MKTKIVVLLIASTVVISATESLKAQLKLDWGIYDSLTVMSKNNVDSLRNPWVGGFDNPQFSTIDVDGDSIEDLFVYDRKSQRVAVFLNKGIPGFPDYRNAPKYANQFPQNLANLGLLVDMNCDGKKDLITTATAGLAMYWNESDTAINFRLKTDWQYILGDASFITSIYNENRPNQIETNIYNLPSDIPGLVDIDGDGAVDIVNFGSFGTTVEYHRNVSLERYDSCDSIKFVFTTGCWGNFSEGSSSNKIFLNTPCRPPMIGSDGLISAPVKKSNSRHAGSTLLPLDLNGNEVMDLVLGDIDATNMVSLINGGTKTSANMVSFDTAFPSYDVPVDVTLMPGGFHVDVDGDGKRDLLVAPNLPNASINTDNVHYYRNFGSDNNPFFQLQTKKFLVDSILDFGSDATVQFVDINGDSLLDIIVGGLGVYNGAANYTSKLIFIENIGSKNLPKFKISDEDYGGLSNLNDKGLAPFFYDLDNDGDLDIIMGNNQGDIYYLEKNSTGNYNVSNAFGGQFSVSQYATPTLYDLTNDGKPDLIIGNRNGTLSFIENTGTGANNFFDETRIVHNFGGVELKFGFANTGYTSAFFAQMDENGFGADTGQSMDTYLFVAAENGFIYLFNNIEGNLQGNFTKIDSLYTGTYRPVITGGDLTNNGKADILIGTATGGLVMLMKDFGFKPSTPPIIDTYSPALNSELEIQVFPNPSNGVFELQTKNLNHAESLLIHVFDVNGRMVWEGIKADDANRFLIDINDQQSGLYFLRISSSKGQMASKKLLKL